MSTDRVRGYAREEAMRFGTTAGRILSKSRKWEDVSARAAVMRRLREDGFSLSLIGRWMGRDHTTVGYHCVETEARAA
jgi:chromosomal replication initiation ATPase DnaA